MAINFIEIMKTYLTHDVVLCLGRSGSHDDKITALVR